MRFRSQNVQHIIQLEKESADRIARENSKAGLLRTLQVPRTYNPEAPRMGGSTGYPVWFRIQALELAAVTNPHFAATVAQVSLASLYRWSVRLAPYRQTGNKERVILTGHDQMLLTMAIYINPTSNADEICAYIARNGGGVYTRRQVYKRFKELGVTRKIGSIEAYAAFTPRNLLRARLFRTEGLPLGVQGIARRALIDIDETRFALKKVQTRRGYAMRCVRVRDTGEYRRGQDSLNLIIGIEPGHPNIPPDELGSIKNPRKWYFITERNCDQFLFADFIDYICRDIENDPCEGDDFRVFMYDNLSAHLTPLIFHTLEERESADVHRFTGLPRPPYQPKYGPIEYIIGQISTKLTQMHDGNWTKDTLRDALRAICRSIGNDGVSNRTFSFVGYPA